MIRGRLNLKMNDLKRSRSCGKCFFALAVVISIVIIGTVAWQPQARADGSLRPMTLTVEALNGTEIVLRGSDIGSLASYRAYGGLRTMEGIDNSSLGNYTGVPLTTFLDMVNDEPSMIGYGYSVTVIAPDYSQTLSYEALNGTGLNTYDNVTGVQVQANQTLTPMVAYYYNDQNLSSTTGPLELAIVGPEGLCTDGNLWVTNVTRLEVHPNLPPLNLTLVGLDGTQVIINETTISNLPAIRAYGGLLGHGGISYLGNYTGIPLTTLCTLVGGVGNGSSLLVTASDNYSITLSYAQLNGNWTTYNASGQLINQTQPLTPIIAYYMNDANITSAEGGPLQLAIVGPEGLITEGRYWVHYVVSIEIQSASVPEFSAPSLIPIFMVATMIAMMIAAIVFRKKFSAQ
jgi:hypothetical protein